VGGVSERVDAKAGGSNPFARGSFAGRDGERHPGLLEAGVLRGASLEGRSWSVRKRVAVPPPRASAPATPDVRRTPRRGTSSAYVKSCVGAHDLHPGAGLRGRVLHSVLRPVHVNPHEASREQSPVVRRSRWYHGTANPLRRDKTGTGVITNGRSAARRVSPLQQTERAWHERKGWRSGPPSLRGQESSGLVARTSIVSCRSR